MTKTLNRSEVKNYIETLSINVIENELTRKNNSIQRLEKELKSGIYADTKREIKSWDIDRNKKELQHMKMIANLLEEKIDREMEEVKKKGNKIKSNTKVFGNFSYDFFSKQTNRQHFPIFSTQYSSFLMENLSNRFRITNKRVEKDNLKIRIFVRDKVTNGKFELEMVNANKQWNVLRINYEDIDTKGEKKYIQMKQIEFNNQDDINKSLLEVIQKVYGRR